MDYLYRLESLEEKSFHCHQQSISRHFVTNLYLDIFVDVAFPQNNHSETLIIPQSSGLCSSETCTYAGGGLREGFNRGSERADLVMYYLSEYFLRICFGDLGVLSII